ncbi:hypothetical protein BJX61DRAFT_442263 [Aspergillus egyptiacus]|nr:hypothetical protein BJX61DRAFT_442263 [Aspergillus egyptiacus]
MAAPPNPFAVLHQTDGAASSTGRGRGGAFNRPTPFQPRGASNNVSRDSNSRGRGRGRGAPGVIRGARGNARGAASNTWRASKPDAQSSSAPQTASPFSQLKQKQYPTVSASSPSSQQKPPFSGFGRGSTRPSSGAPSTRGGTLVNFRKDARQTSVTQLTNGASGVGAGVPVEDVSAMGSYNDRYEQSIAPKNGNELSRPDTWPTPTSPCP